MSILRFATEGQARRYLKSKIYKEELMEWMLAIFCLGLVLFTIFVLLH